MEQSLISCQEVRTGNIGAIRTSEKVRDRSSTVANFVIGCLESRDRIRRSHWRRKEIAQLGDQSSRAGVDPLIGRSTLTTSLLLTEI